MIKERTVLDTFYIVVVVVVTLLALAVLILIELTERTELKGVVH